MQEIATEKARRNFRRLLDDAEDGEHFIITKYGEGVAALIPIMWWQGAASLTEEMHLAFEAGAPPAPEKWRELGARASALFALIPAEGAFVSSRELRGWTPDDAKSVPLTHDKPEQGS